MTACCRPSLLVLLALGVLASTSSIAAGKDKEGADHPLISRFPESFIRRYATFDFDRAALVSGPLIKDENGDRVFDTLEFEGSVTNIEYRLKGTQSSVLEILKNYERAVGKLGATVEFRCLREACHPATPAARAITNTINRSGSVLNGVGADGGQEVAVMTAVGNGFAMMVVIGADNANRRRTISQSVIEFGALDDEQLVIGSVDEIRDGLVARGRVILDGIYFDYDKATLKPESDAVIELLATYLRDHPEQSFFIVGHTDAVGDYDYNLDLSTRRAKAVKAAVAASEGLDSDRLFPIGVGPVAPAASNRDDAGRARNRRVEIVEVPE